MMGLLAAQCDVFCLVLFVAQQMGNKLSPCSREVLGERRTTGRRFSQNAMSAWHDCADNNPHNTTPAQGNDFVSSKGQ